MKTIGINTEIKQKIRDQGDENESINSILTRLLDDADSISPNTKPKRCNIHISEETFQRLAELKTPSESFGSVILRLLNSKDEI